MFPLYSEAQVRKRRRRKRLRAGKIEGKVIRYSCAVLKCHIGGEGDESICFKKPLWSALGEQGKCLEGTRPIVMLSLRHVPMMYCSLQGEIRGKHGNAKNLLEEGNIFSRCRSKQDSINR